MPPVSARTVGRSSAQRRGRRRRRGVARRDGFGARCAAPAQKRTRPPQLRHCVDEDRNGTVRRQPRLKRGFHVRRRVAGHDAPARDVNWRGRVARRRAGGRLAAARHVRVRTFSYRAVVAQPVHCRVGEAAVAAVRRVVARDELLLGQRDERAAGHGGRALHGAGGRKGPARAALPLVLDRADNTRDVAPVL